MLLLFKKYLVLWKSINTLSQKALECY